MELRQLRYLEAVARHRSFTRAARELHISQSALSHQVSGLERELGVELLTRSTRSVAVTEIGELVLARSRRALAEVDGVRADLDGLRGLLRGTLRLGGPPIGCLQSAALIAAFTRAHPAVTVTIREGGASELLDGLRHGALDMASTLIDADGLDGLEALRLPDAELVAAVAPDHPLAQSEHVPVKRLASEPLITCGAGGALRDALRALAPEARVVAEANTLATVVELTARGVGVTLLPRSALGPGGDGLAIRPLSPPHTLPVSLLWRAGEHPTPVAHAFREHVHASVQG